MEELGCLLVLIVDFLLIAFGWAIITWVLTAFGVFIEFTWTNAFAFYIILKLLKILL